MKRVLIAGGAGFVGSSVALRLRQAFPSAEILCLDNLHRQGSELNRDRLATAGIRFLFGDVRHVLSMELPKCDLIVDAAAEPSVMAGIGASDAEYVVGTNLIGTLHLLELARSWKSMFLFISTSRIYPVEKLRQLKLVETELRFDLCEDQPMSGASAMGVSEGFPTVGNRTLYGATKYAAEVMVGEYAACFGVKAIIDRCGVIAGPWQMARVDQGILGLWVVRHYYRQPLQYIGYKGKQVRDILHVEDFADLVLRQMESPAAWTGEVFNVGGGRVNSISLLELSGLVSEVSGRSPNVGVDNAVRPGDIPLYVTDAGRVQQVFGWSASRRLPDIVKDTWEWVRNNERELRAVFPN